MARARNIKPGFFTNDVLAECSPLARILFAGLWTIADRAGRLEDRPKKIKAEILPYDDCDIEQLLNQLAGKAFIIRYVVDGKAFIQIDKFDKHQNPHVKEAESLIPAPDKNRTTPVQDTTQDGTSRADSLLLIPDSLNPITPLAPSSKPLDASPTVESIFLVDGSEFRVTQAMVDEFDRLYPAVDIPQTLREMRAWSMANPKKRKTKTGAMRFINSWLASEQNKPAAR